MVRLELIWLLLTALIAFAVILPIYLYLDYYPFLLINSVFILTFITLTRYIFHLRYTFLARRQILKIAFTFLCIPLLFFLVQNLNQFQVYLDEEGIDVLVGQLPYGERNGVVEYIRGEMLLFGVGSIIGAAVFPLRLMLSVWRTHNRGTV